MHKIDYNDLCSKFQAILNLSDESIKLEILPGTHQNQLKGSNLKWDDVSDTWIIEFVEQHDFFLAHELGHIYLSKKYSCPFFAKQTQVPVNVKIGFYTNCIIDSFVNYNLTKYDFIYPYFLNLINIYLTHGKNGPDPNTPDLLGFYLNSYLDMHYNLKKENFDERKSKFSNYFKNFEKLILKNSSISQGALNIIKKELIRFEDFKEMEKNTSVIGYIFLVLKVIPFWSNFELAKNIRLIFNIKKKK